MPAQGTLLASSDDYPRSPGASTSAPGEANPGIAPAGSADEYPGATELFVRIAHAGMGRSTRSEALANIVDACVGIAGARHALLIETRRDLSINWGDGYVFADRSLDDRVRHALERVFGSSIFAGRGPAEPVVLTELVPGLGPVHAAVTTLADSLEPRCLLVLLKIDSRDGYSSADLCLIRDVAAEVSLAVQAARSEDEVRHRNNERSVLSRITQTVVSMQGLDHVLNEVAAAVRSISGWDVCSVALFSREVDALTVRAVSADPGTGQLSQKPGERIRLSEWQNLRFALDNCVPYLLTTDQAESLTHHERSYLARLSIGSLLAVPIVAAGESAGLALLYSSTSRSLDSRTMRTVDEISAQAALAVQHGQYADAARQQAEEQTALLRVSQAVISGKDLQVILAEVARVSLGFEGVEACRIVLWHQETDQFELAAEQNVRDWQMFYQVGDRYPAADWPSSRTIIHSKTARGYQTSDQELTARERANHVADQIQAFHSFPIMVGDSAVGVLSLLNRAKVRFSPSAIRIGHELAAQAAHAIDRTNLFRQLHRRAETDGLTGLLNHRAGFETLDRELAAAKKLDEPLSIIILDLDDFKLFNDTHGHLTGDRVLVEVSNALKESCRARDYVARYGGDEFLLILPGTNHELAAQVADRLLRRMERAIVRVGSLELPIRTSVGLATYPRDASNRQELIAYGDAAMYSAKELGGGQLGTVQKATRSLEVTVFGALSGLVRAVDRKDRYTKDHSDMVAEFAVRIGNYLRLTEAEINALEIAGLLHDVGKIAVPDSILRKPGRLTPDEEAMIRQHVVFSELMIKGVPNLDLVLQAVGHHHERWDGLGYPYNKSGDEIPLLGRILALADALAAMTHDRPYRKGRTLEQALTELRKGAGTQFDPDLVDPAVAAVSTGTALLREEHRRQRLNPHDYDPDNPPEPVGMTDYLRLRREAQERESA
jgi:diguanylate cyclase (GGDEF)-like protein